MNKKLLREYVDLILSESVETKPANIQRMAIGRAIASSGNFDFSPTSSNPSTSSGIRLNLTPSNKDKDSDEIGALLKADALFIDIIANDGEQLSTSTSYKSFQLKNSAAWLQTTTGEKWIIETLIEEGNAENQESAKAIVKSWYPVGKKKGKFLKTNDIIVVNPKPLASRLWTGQGIGELAEYAVAAAVNGNQDEQFTKAITGAILRPSWKKANNGSSESAPTTDEANKFRAHFDAMVGITETNMGTAASNKNKKIQELFGFEASVQGGGGGLVDVVTNVADIHVKFNEPSRLSGNQQKGVSRKQAVTDNDSLMAKVLQLERGRADAYWKQMRDWFKQYADIKEKKDKEPLMNLGFYEWLLNGTILPKLQAELDQNPVLQAWIKKQTPSIEINEYISQYLITDFVHAMTPDSRKDTGTVPSNVFYFTFYPARRSEKPGTYRLKIEELNNQLGSLVTVPELAVNLKVIMNPNYKGSGGGSVGHPYVIADATTGEVYAKLEFRSTASSKPIQFHRGKSFSSSDPNDGKFISKTLIELRQIIKRILLEETSKDNTTVI